MIIGPGTSVVAEPTATVPIPLANRYALAGSVRVPNE
jgi:hypothetical protein